MKRLDRWMEAAIDWVYMLGVKHRVKKGTADRYEREIYEGWNK